MVRGSKAFNKEFLDLIQDVCDYRRQNCQGWRGPAKVLVKESLCVLIRHGAESYGMHPCHLMKANKKFGSPKNEENKELGKPRDESNKIDKNEINEVLGEEEEGQLNKSLHINREELKDNSKKK